MFHLVADLLERLDYIGLVVLPATKRKRFFRGDLAEGSKGMMFLFDGLWLDFKTAKKIEW